MDGTTDPADFDIDFGDLDVPIDDIDFSAVETLLELEPGTKSTPNSDTTPSDKPYHAKRPHKKSRAGYVHMRAVARRPCLETSR